MGSSPTARVAWGVDLGDPQNTSEGFDWDEAGLDEHDFETGAMPRLLGWSEAPPELPDGWRDWTTDQRTTWRATIREPYEQRFHAAVPLKFVHYGYEFGGTALVLRRSSASVEWGCDPVDPATLAEPSPSELAAFATVLAALRYDAGPPRLLIMALYG